MAPRPDGCAAGRDAVLCAMFDRPLMSFVDRFKFGSLLAIFIAASDRMNLPRCPPSICRTCSDAHDPWQSAKVVRSAIKPTKVVPRARKVRAGSQTYRSAIADCVADVASCPRESVGQNYFTLPISLKPLAALKASRPAGMPQ